MTETDLLELLEEARLACGKNAGKLAAYLGARVPAHDTEVRTLIEKRIHAYTGKYVVLPLPPGGEVEQPLVPPALAKQSGQVDEMLSSSPSDPNVGPCHVCGLPLRVGDWGCISTIRPHAPSVQTNTFVAYFDFALGIQVNNLGDRRAAMRGTIDKDSGARVGQLDYREKMNKGDLSARLDRVEAQRKEQARRR